MLVCMLALTGFKMQAQEQKLRVAVFDPTTSGITIDNGTKLAVQELISSTFVNIGKFVIVERSMIDKIMREQVFQNSDMADNSQATEVGKLAGANKIVLSVISLIGGRNMLSIKIIDVQTATIDQQKTKIVNNSDLLDVVEPLTLELLGEKVTYQQPTQQSVTSPPSPTSSLSKLSKSDTDEQIQTNTIYTVFEELEIMVLNRSLGSTTWFQAKEMCAELNEGGFSDWYLLSKNELEVIFEKNNEKQINSMPDYKRFINGLSSYWYWSSTEIDNKKAYNVSKNVWVSDEKKKAESPDCLCGRKINR